MDGERARGGPAPPLEIRLLGPVQVLRQGAPVALPKSKKTVALLAYLALTARACRRARLCELLWADSSDPKGSLRWSLSKLRGVLGGDGRGCLAADGEELRFDHELAAVDLLAVRRGLAERDPTTEALVEAASAFRGELLEDVDLPDCPVFHAWHVAEREEARALRRRVLDALVDRLRPEPDEALPFARGRLELDRADDRAHATVLDLLRETGRAREAEEHYRAHKLWLEAQQKSPGPQVLRAWHALRSGGPPAAREHRADLAERPRAAAPVPHDLGPQEVRFCTAADGVRIAYATMGTGPPLVKTANWLNHLELDLQSSVWRHWVRELSRGRQLIRYDERGNGLSDWEVEDLSLDAFVHDLETVVEAAGLGRFPLLGISQGCAVAVEYAARHPERVSHLALYGGFAQGWRARGRPKEIETGEAMMALTRHGWGRPHPAFRQVFTSLYFPDATTDEMQAFNELQRRSTSAEGASRLLSVFGDIDVTARLADVRARTLVLHARHDGLIPYQEGRRLAAGIPGARFVLLDSRNHLLVEQEPACSRFFEELRRFLAEPA